MKTSLRVLFLLQFLLIMLLGLVNIGVQTGSFAAADAAESSSCPADCAAASTKAA